MGMNDIKCVCGIHTSVSESFSLERSDSEALSSLSGLYLRFILTIFDVILYNYV